MRLTLALLLPAILCGQYVKVAPYYTPGAGTQNVTTSAGTDTDVDLLQMGSMGRTLMPRTDKVYQIAVYLPADVATYATGIWFATNTVTSNSGGAPTVLTLESKTQTFTGPFTSAAVNTFTPATPLSVTKWDALSMHITFASGHPASINVGSAQLIPAVSGQGQSTQAEKCYYQLNVTNPATYTLASMTLISNAGCVIIGAYMTPPVVVGIGDSLMGTDAPEPSDSFADAATQSFPPPGLFAPPHFWLANYNPVPTYQGMAWAGQTAVQVNARFATDCVALKPIYCVINGGINDLNACGAGGCSGAQITTIETALGNMFSACQTNGIKCLYLLMGPWQGANASNATMTSEDTVNSWSLANAPTYGVIPIDLRCWIGVNRVGGSAGNCWNWNATYEYTVDGLAVHWNQAGSTLIGNDMFTSFPVFYNPVQTTVVP